MNMQHARIVLRPRGVLDAIDLAVRLLRAEGKTFGPLVLAVLVPLTACCLLADRFGFGLAATIALFAALPIVELPFTVAASKLVFQPQVTVREVLKEALRCTPGLVALRLGELVLLAIGFVMVTVPAFLVAVGSFFLGETYVLERSGLGSAITRSRTLGYAGFGEALAGTLVFITARCVAFGLGDVAGRSIIHDVFGFKSPITVFDEGSYSSALVFSILAIPVLSVGRFLLYIAVRTNLEGWDIQTNFTQIRIDSEARRAEALSGVTP